MIIEVDRSDLHRMRVVPEDDGALAPGTARLRIDAFGLTANNVSYAAFGDMLRYWDFFPAAPADDDEDPRFLPPLPPDLPAFWRTFSSE